MDLQYLTYCNQTVMNSEAIFVFIFCARLLTFTEGKCGVRVLGMLPERQARFPWEISSRTGRGIPEYQGYRQEAQRNQEHGGQRGNPRASESRQHEVYGSICDLKRCFLDGLFSFQKWDSKLALGAQEVADECRVKHMFVGDGKMDLGEIVARNKEVLL